MIKKRHSILNCKTNIENSFYIEANIDIDKYFDDFKTNQLFIQFTTQIKEKSLAK